MTNIFRPSSEFCCRPFIIFQKFAKKKKHLKIVQLCISILIAYLLSFSDDTLNLQLVPT